MSRTIDHGLQSNKKRNSQPLYKRIADTNESNTNPRIGSEINSIGQRRRRWCHRGCCSGQKSWKFNTKTTALYTTCFLLKLHRLTCVSMCALIWHFSIQKPPKFIKTFKNHRLKHKCAPRSRSGGGRGGHGGGTAVLNYMWKCNAVFQEGYVMSLI